MYASHIYQKGERKQTHKITREIAEQWKNKIKQTYTNKHKMGHQVQAKHCLCTKETVKKLWKNRRKLKKTHTHTHTQKYRGIKETCRNKNEKHGKNKHKLGNQV